MPDPRRWNLSDFQRRGVAHDLNNVLSGIVSYPELILMDLPEESKLIKPIYPTVKINIDLDKDLFHVNGSYVHIRKAVMNLVSNAWEAVKEPGKVARPKTAMWIDP